MKTKFLLCMLMLLGQFCFGQKEGNIWMFGDSAGISFNTIPPHALLNGLAYTGEASSSICDKNGNLLFYAGAKNPVINSYINIWNQNNQIILNGNDLAGYSTFTQGALLIPDPQNDSIIFLFHIDFNGLYYSKINKKGDSGNGEVINKNTLLLQTDSITEKLIAVRHANGRDWWVLAHRSGNNTFVKYILQKDTILGPFEQNIGSVHTTGLYLYAGSEGQMCISKNGDKLACVTLNGLIDVFDFDRCRGDITNWKKLGDSITQFYGCCFSLDNSQFYITTGNESQNVYSRLFQYDLNASNIIASRTLIFEQQNYITHFGQMQLGIDNKIYLTKGMGSGSSTINDSINMFLGIINFPNLSGTLCDFDEFGAYLGGERAYLGLPNIPNYALGKIEGSACDTIPEPPQPHETEAVIYIPNIFSPNGDGQNDVFRVRGEQIASVHLMVYNRWGNIVFESNDMSYAWDGMFQGKACEVGVYAWMAEIVMKNGINLFRKGNVSLVR